MKQGRGFSYRVKEIRDIHVATPPEIIYSREPSRLGAGHNTEEVLEERLVARDRQGALVAEPVLFFRLQQKLLEDRVVQVRCAHHEPRSARAHTHRHVSRRDIQRCATHLYA